MSIYDKEYTLGEAICEIEKDNKKVFVTSNITLKYNGACIYAYENDDLDPTSFKLAVMRIWKLQKPEPKEVGFMEAVKAFEDYKTIKCEHNKLNGCVYKRINNYNKQIKDVADRALSTTEILEGKWYILED